MTGFVYFIEAVGAEAIKIGFSRNPAKRLRSMASGSPFPLRLLAVFPATQSAELVLHDELWAYRTHGEWFNDCPLIRKAMAGAVALASGLIREEAQA